MIDKIILDLIIKVNPPPVCLCCMGSGKKFTPRWEDINEVAKVMVVEESPCPACQSDTPDADITILDIVI